MTLIPGRRYNTFSRFLYPMERARYTPCIRKRSLPEMKYGRYPPIYSRATSAITMLVRVRTRVNKYNDAPPPPPRPVSRSRHFTFTREKTPALLYSVGKKLRDFHAPPPPPPPRPSTIYLRIYRIVGWTIVWTVISSKVVRILLDQTFLKNE